MNQIIDKVEILNRHTGDSEGALLFDGLSDEHLNDFETIWKPILSQKEYEIRLRNSSNGEIDRASYYAELGKFGIEDSHWDWRRKKKAFEGQLTYRTFSLECNMTLQGLMTVNLGKVCQLPSQRNKPLVYIEFLAVAPWNRPQLTTKPNYKYIGHVLIAVAISLSIEEEYKGRIGLHSLPQAASFYKDKVGMINLGPDEHHQNLSYYEITPDNAKIFLNP